MSSFRRREDAKQHKRKNGRKDKSEFESRHLEHKVRKMIMKDKSDKYRKYDQEDF